MSVNVMEKDGLKLIAGNCGNGSIQDTNIRIDDIELQIMLSKTMQPKSIGSKSIFSMVSYAPGDKEKQPDDVEYFWGLYYSDSIVFSITATLKGFTVKINRMYIGMNDISLNYPLPPQEFKYDELGLEHTDGSGGYTDWMKVNTAINIDLYVRGMLDENNQLIIIYFGIGSLIPDGIDMTSVKNVTNIISKANNNNVMLVALDNQSKWVIRDRAGSKTILEAAEPVFY